MPTATSETQICNLALMRCGTAQIGALTEANKRAEACALHYGPTRDAVLRAHPWNFATRRAELAQQDAEHATFEFAYKYPLPSDFLKLTRTDLEAFGYTEGIDYRVELDSTQTLCLFSPESSHFIEYTARVSNVAVYDPLFVDVLAARLAAEIAPWITDNAALAGKLWEVYDAKLREARGVDAQEGVPRDITANAWLVSRV
jgi:hypothetical protein